MKIVYIDAQNVYVTIKRAWREIDWARFFIYLQNKFQVDIVYYTVWYVPRYKHIYQILIDIWYTMLFKKTLILPDWTIKGNVDIDIAIRSILELKDRIVSTAYLVTNDGGYNTLIMTLQNYNVWWCLLTPDWYIASRLLKRCQVKIINMQDIKSKIQKLPCL